MWVSDKGSKPQKVQERIEGIPVDGLVDSRADITILVGKHQESGIICVVT